MLYFWYREQSPAPRFSTAMASNYSSNPSNSLVINKAHIVAEGETDEGGAGQSTLTLMGTRVWRKHEGLRGQRDQRLRLDLFLSKELWIVLTESVHIHRFHLLTPVLHLFDAIWQKRLTFALFAWSSLIPICCHKRRSDSAEGRSENNDDLKINAHMKTSEHFLTHRTFFLTDIILMLGVASGIG